MNGKNDGCCMRTVVVISLEKHIAVFLLWIASFPDHNHDDEDDNDDDGDED